MILKCISVKSEAGVRNLIRYVSRDDKVVPEIKLPTSHRNWYAPGIKLSKDDKKYLESERFDSALLSALKNFKGNTKEFIQHLMNSKSKESGGKDNGIPALVMRHNIHSRFVDGYIKEFIENEATRVHTHAKTA